MVQRFVSTDFGMVQANAPFVRDADGRRVTENRVNVPQEDGTVMSVPTQRFDETGMPVQETPEDVMARGEGQAFATDEEATAFRDGREAAFDEARPARPEVVSDVDMNVVDTAKIEAQGFLTDTSVTSGIKIQGAPGLNPSVKLSLGLTVAIAATVEEMIDPTDTVNVAIAIAETPDTAFPQAVADRIGITVEAMAVATMEELQEIGVGEEAFEGLTAREIFEALTGLPEMVEAGAITPARATFLAMKSMALILGPDGTGDPFVDSALEKEALRILIAINEEDPDNSDVKDLLLGFVPGRTNKDAFDFAQLVSRGNAGLFDTSDVFEEVKARLLGLSSQDFVRALPPLWNLVLEATDGDVDLASVLFADLTEDSSLVSTDLTIDALFVALEFTPLGFVGPISRGLTKAGEKISRGILNRSFFKPSMIRTFDGQVGPASDELAATVINDAKTSPSVRAGAQADDLEIQMASTPLEEGGPLTVVKPKVASRSTQKAIETEAEELARQQTEAARAGGKTPKQTNELAIIKKVEGSPRVGEFDVGEPFFAAKADVAKAIERIVPDNFGIDFTKKGLFRLVANDAAFIKHLEDMLIFDTAEFSKFSFKTKAAERAALVGAETVPRKITPTGLIVETKFSEKALPGFTETERAVTFEIPLTKDTADLNFGDVNVIKGKFARAVGSPENFLQRLEKGDLIIDRGTEVGREFARNQNILGKELRTSQKGLSVNQRNQLSAVIEKGDSIGKQFSLGKLRGDFFTREVTKGGKTTLETFRLTDKQIESYYRLRQIFDSQFELVNAADNRRRVFAGQLEVNLEVFATPKGSLDQIIMGEQSSWKVFVRRADAAELEGVLKVIDTTGTKVTSRAVTPTLMKQIENGSVKLVKGADGPIEIAIGKQGAKRTASGRTILKGATKFEDINFMIVRGTNAGANGTSRVLQPLSHYTVPYREGFAPLIRQNVNNVVLRKGVRRIDGVDAAVMKPIGLAASRQGAQGIIDKAAKAEGLTAEEAAKVFEIGDSQEVRARFGDIGLNNGGPSNRAFREMTTDSLAGRVDVFDSINQALTRTSRTASSAELKLQLTEGFLQTTKGKLVNAGDFDSPINTSISKGGVGREEAAKIEQLRDTIKAIVGLPTRDERVIASLVNQLIRFVQPEDALARVKPTTVNLLHQAAGLDPTSIIRGGTFHLLLGAFNPASFFTQAAAISVPLSLAPQRFPKIMSQLLQFQSAALLRKSPEKLKILAKTLSLDETEFLAGVKLFDERGFFDSVFNSADLRGSGMGVPLTTSAVKRAVNLTSMAPFGGGEWLQRGYGFLFAVDEAVRKTGIKLSKMNDEQINTVMKRARDVSFRMDSVNQARFQRNPFTSIPTQFFQVITKHVEDLTGQTNKFTRSERAKIFVGSIVFFGALGLPFVPHDLVLNQAREAGVDVDDPIIRSFIEQGAVGTMQQIFFGDDVAVTSSRFSILRGMEDIIRSVNLFVPMLDDSRQRPGIGAAFSLWTRGGKAFEDIVTAVTIATDPNITEFGGTPRPVWQEVIEAIARVPTASKNILTANEWARMSRIVDANGELLMDPRDERFLAAVAAKAFGFGLMDATDSQQIKEREQDVIEIEKRATEIMRAQMNNFLSGEIDAQTYNIIGITVCTSFGVSPDRCDKMLLNVWERGIETETIFQKKRDEAAENILKGASEGDIRETQENILELTEDKQLNPTATEQRLRIEQEAKDKDNNDGS